MNDRPRNNIDDDDDILSWGDLPKAERMALRRSAQSQIFWGNVGKKIKGAGPVIAVVLSFLALINLGGEWIKEWLTRP